MVESMDLGVPESNTWISYLDEHIILHLCLTRLRSILFLTAERVLRDPGYPTCPYETPPWIVLLCRVIFLSAPSSKAFGTTHNTALKLLWIWSPHTIAQNVINNNPFISMEFSSKELKESSIYFFSLHLVFVQSNKNIYSQVVWP